VNAPAPTPARDAEALGAALARLDDCFVRLARWTCELPPLLDGLLTALAPPGRGPPGWSRLAHHTPRQEHAPPHHRGGAFSYL